MIKVTFLGTNGFFSNKLGDTLCTVIETDNYNIILDAGSGISKLDKVISFNKETYLLISHMHLDHINGLFILPKFNFLKGLTICSAEESFYDLQKIMDFPYIAPPRMYNYNIDFLSLGKDIDTLPFGLKILPVVHSVHTVGFRMKIQSRVISFITDTGICDNAVVLADNSDLLICECSHLSGQVNPEWPHMNPEEAATLAKCSNSEHLILTHFDANRYLTFKDRIKAEKTAGKFFHSVAAVKDMDEYCLISDTATQYKF
jgi:ribonuclease BN (tRNA processing enzyme)